MGTRHLTVVHDFHKNELVNMYGQFDGYLSGHGVDLKEFLTGFTIVNGVSGDDDRNPKCANGMGCLAAQIVRHFKNCPRTELPINSSFHLVTPGKRGFGEEFIYTIYIPDEYQERYYNLFEARPDFPLHIRVQKGRVTFFGAPGTNPEEMAILYDGPVNEFEPLKIEEKV